MFPVLRKDIVNLLFGLDGGLEVAENGVLLLLWASDRLGEVCIEFRNLEGGVVVGTTHRLDAEHGEI